MAREYCRWGSSTRCGSRRWPRRRGHRSSKARSPLPAHNGQAAACALGCLEPATRVLLRESAAGRSEALLRAALDSKRGVWRHMSLADLPMLPDIRPSMQTEWCIESRFRLFSIFTLGIPAIGCRIGLHFRRCISTCTGYRVRAWGMMVPIWLRTVRVLMQHSAYIVDVPLCDVIPMDDEPTIHVQMQVCEDRVTLDVRRHVEDLHATSPDDIGYSSVWNPFL